MTSQKPVPEPKGDIIVAGHICVDLIPEIPPGKESMGELLSSGKLLSVGPITTSTGGAVANTGLGLYKLGLPVRLMGKVGADPLGHVLRSLLDQTLDGMSHNMVVDEASRTSYTVVVSPPGIDRAFMHHPGANDTYSAADLDRLDKKGACVFHFGYPPLMKRLYEDNGVELEKILRAADGLVTSIDMALPDPDAPSGRADWQAILQRALPLTDLFVPSFEEIAYMLGLADEPLTIQALDRISSWILEAGAAVAVIKLGDNGIYLRSTSETGRLKKLEEKCGCLATEWTGRELISPCFQVDVVGSTGSGDTTISGLLAELACGSRPESALSFATAVGACACEAPDATGGLRSRKEIRRRMDAGWKKHDLSLERDGWTWNQQNQVWQGPHDSLLSSKA